MEKLVPNSAVQIVPDQIILATRGMVIVCWAVWMAFTEPCVTRVSNCTNLRAYENSGNLTLICVVLN